MNDLANEQNEKDGAGNNSFRVIGVREVVPGKLIFARRHGLDIASEAQHGHPLDRS